MSKKSRFAKLPAHCRILKMERSPDRVLIQLQEASFATLNVHHLATAWKALRLSIVCVMFKATSLSGKPRYLNALKPPVQRSSNWRMESQNAPETSLKTLVSLNAKMVIFSKASIHYNAWERKDGQVNIPNVSEKLSQRLKNLHQIHLL